MSQPVILKVYANLFPADTALFGSVREAAASALASEEDSESVFLEDGILRISFEGLYFPSDEVLACIRSRLQPEQQGKLDVLDMENWTITRYTFTGGFIQEHRTRSLNTVMDYNGF